MGGALLGRDTSSIECGSRSRESWKPWDMERKDRGNMDNMNGCYIEGSGRE